MLTISLVPKELGSKDEGRAFLLNFGVHVQAYTVSRCHFFT
jgi:hypothetical protein